VLLLGAGGQVGSELLRTLAPLGEIAAPLRAEVDLSDADAVVRMLGEVQPALIVNAAAYTAVDRAEREPEAAALLNSQLPELLAGFAAKHGARLVHYSTDYVFNGRKTGAYAETDPTDPLGIYGRTKLAGEAAVLEGSSRNLVLRTSWVYGARGRNFVRAILAKAQSGAALQVVDDQRGAPTWCRSLAEATAAMLQADPGSSHGGLYHATSGGETTWFGFAQEVLRLAQLPASITPVPSTAYKTDAARPANSVLDNAKLKRDFGVALPDWRDALRDCMRNWPAGQSTG
jgi:dTDP-4-dehydrorhamnose reductase